MGVPAEQLLLVNSAGERIDVDALLQSLRTLPERILADDEFGIVVYVGGFDVYSLTPTDSGEFLAQPVTEISRPRFSAQLLRKQIGGTVLSVTADKVFIVREENKVKKVRAEDLKAGMILASGEKIYR